MMLFQLLQTFVLFSYITGFTAEIPMYAKTGDSFQLDVPTHEMQGFDYFSWINDNATNIVGYTYGGRIKLDPSYENRIYFNNTTFSLTLMNVLKADSGLYTSKKGFPDKVILTYRVSVIDEVQTPVLNKDSILSGSELCNFTCSGQDLNISSIYNNSSCSEERVTSADNHTLKVNCNDTFIMCNYSNPVSWKTEIKEINKLCTATQEKLSDNSAYPLLISLLCLFTLGLLVFVGVFCFYKRKKDGSYKPSNSDNTTYDAVGVNIKQSTTLDALEKVSTVYDTVREHEAPLTNPTSAQNGEANQHKSPTEESKSNVSITIYSTIDHIPKPEHTIYAAVNKRTIKYESAHPQPE